MLAEAGYPNGFETQIETAATYPDMVETAQGFKQLKAIGINAKINQLEWGNYIETEIQGHELDGRPQHFWCRC